MLLSSRRRGGIVRPLRGHALDRRVVLLGLLFLIGVGAGTAAALRMDWETGSLPRTIAQGYLRIRPAQSMQELFWHAFLPDLLLFSLVFFCGFCVLASAPVLLFLPLFKGIGFGACASFLLKECGFSAVKPIAFSLFPGVIWSTFLLLLACRDAWRMSIGLSEAAAGISSAFPRRFCARMLLYLLLLMLGGALQTRLSFLFWGGLPQV